MQTVNDDRPSTPRVQVRVMQVRCGSTVHQTLLLPGTGLFARKTIRSRERKFHVWNFCSHAYTLQSSNAKNSDVDVSKALRLRYRPTVRLLADVKYMPDVR